MTDLERVLVKALQEVRPQIADDARSALESCCRLDRKTLRPDRSTLDPIDAPAVAFAEHQLRVVDRALAKAGIRRKVGQ